MLPKQNVSEVVQKHFASSANVSSFKRRGSILGNKVSATIFPRLRAPLKIYDGVIFPPRLRRTMLAKG